MFAIGHSLKKGTDAIWQHFVCHWEPWCCDNVLFKRSNIANDSCIAFGTQSIPTVRSWRSQQGRKCDQQLPIHDEVDGVVLCEWHSHDYDHTESCICFHVVWFVRSSLKLCRSIFLCHCNSLFFLLERILMVQFPNLVTSYAYHSNTEFWQVLTFKFASCVVLSLNSCSCQYTNYPQIIGIAEWSFDSWMLKQTPHHSSDVTPNLD